MCVCVAASGPTRLDVACASHRGSSLACFQRRTAWTALVPYAEAPAWLGPRCVSTLAAQVRGSDHERPSLLTCGRTLSCTQNHDLALDIAQHVRNCPHLHPVESLLTPPRSACIHSWGGDGGRRRAGLFRRVFASTTTSIVLFFHVHNRPNTCHPRPLKVLERPWAGRALGGGLCSPFRGP